MKGLMGQYPQNFGVRTAPCTALNLLSVSDIQSTTLLKRFQPSHSTLCVSLSLRYSVDVQSALYYNVKSYEERVISLYRESYELRTVYFCHFWTGIRCFCVNFECQFGRFVHGTIIGAMPHCCVGFTD